MHLVLGPSGSVFRRSLKTGMQRLLNAHKLLLLFHFLFIKCVLTSEGCFKSWWTYIYKENGEILVYMNVKYNLLRVLCTTVSKIHKNSSWAISELNEIINISLCLKSFFCVPVLLLLSLKRMLRYGGR